MIIIMKQDADQREIDQCIEKIQALGYKARPIIGEERTVVGAVGVINEHKQMLLEELLSIGGVENVVPISKPYKFASKESKDTSVFTIDGVQVGGDKLCVMAGPCSIESEEQIIHIAKEVKKSGATMLRGGAFKPRTSPYSFQGMGEEGLKLLAAAKKETGLPIVTEVMDATQIEVASQYADVLQIGARNVQNFYLLKEVGKSGMPVLLKRGMMTTIQEFLMSAEYIMSEGNSQVMLCERGIRTFETATRNTLDLSCIPVLKRETHLPVIIDPSHGTGYWHLVESMAMASIAAGADGLMIEVHNDPVNAASDGPQSLKPATFDKLMKKARRFAEAAERQL